MEPMGGMMACMLVWGLVGLALLVLVVVTIVWLLRGTVAGARTPHDAAWQELRRRYAAGEIDDDEFDRRGRTLRGR